MKPFPSRKRMIRRGLTAGSFGILQVERGYERVVVGGNRIFVLAQAGDVARDGVLRHFSCLVNSAPISNTARQSRNKRGIAALRFRPEHDVVVVSGHETDTIVLGQPGQTT